MPTLEAKQLGELGGGDVDRRPGLKAGHHRVRQEISDIGEAEVASAHADDAHQQGDAAGERHHPRRIAAAHGGDAGGHGDGER